MTGSTKNQRERKPVAALVRVSTLAQTAEDKYGVPAQKEACERIARVIGQPILQWFEIEDVSGTAVRRSPIMKELLTLVKSGRIEGIVMREESRLMRRADSQVLQILEENQVKLYLPDGIIDFSNSSQKLMGTIKYAFADYERDLIRDRMVGGKRAKLKRGEWASGANSVPFGLELYQDGRADRLRPGKEIGRVIRLFEEFNKGGGFVSFAELARTTGIASEKIGYVLSNPIYTGYHSPKRVVDSSRNVYWPDGRLRYQPRKVVPIAERERIKMFDDAPISEAVFATAQRLLKFRREMRVRLRGDADPFLYRGFLRCAECGRRMISLKYHDGRTFAADYYICQGAQGNRGVKSGTCKTRRIRREALEPILDSTIASKIADRRFLSRIIEAEAATATDAEEQIGRLNVEIEEAKRAIERNQSLFARGRITQEAFDKLDDELQLELRASRVALEKARPNLARITPEMWAPIALLFRQWAMLPKSEKRSLLSAIAPVFEVSGTAGRGHHETVIRVKGFRLDLKGTREPIGEIEENEPDDIKSLSCSAPNVDRSAIYFPL